MNKPNPAIKKKKEIVSPVSKLLSFIDDNLPKFVEKISDTTKISCMEEDVLTEKLVFFLINKARTENFSFMQQPTQEKRRKADIGVFLYGNNLNYIFCIEAKFLPHSPFDYVTGEYAAIIRDLRQENTA